ncbi:hypothetical protein GCM10027361_35260 [Erwinia aphidicola]
MPRAEARRERLLPFRRAQAELSRITERLAMEIFSKDPSVKCPASYYTAITPITATALSTAAMP